MHFSSSSVFLDQYLHVVEFVLILVCTGKTKRSHLFQRHLSLLPTVFLALSSVFLGFVKGISGSSGSSLIFGTGWGRGSNPASLGRAHKETAKNETKQKLTTDTHLSFHKRSNQAQKEMWGN